MRFLVYSIFIGLLLVGCSSKEVISPCQNHIKPNWINDTYVGMSRITASGNKSEQKMIALQRAITPLLMTKGVAKGNASVSANKEFRLENEQEILSKNFNENIDMKVMFDTIFYNVRVINIYEDPCTKFLYIKVEEK